MISRVLVYLQRRTQKNTQDVRRNNTVYPIFSIWKVAWCVQPSSCVLILKSVHCDFYKLHQLLGSTQRVLRVLRTSTNKVQGHIVYGLDKLHLISESTTQRKAIKKVQYVDTQHDFYGVFWSLESSTIDTNTCST